MSLLSLERIPDSVPINALVPVEGTPLATENIIPVWDIIRMIATTRIVMPKTTVRLSAGRTEMSMEAQALCFMAGASSIFAGEKLLTTPNPGEEKDAEMFSLLGLIPTEKKKENVDKFKIRKSILKKNDTVKWTRPGHVIERNLEATKQAKELRKKMK
jgi:biotin synthase